MSKRAEITIPPYRRLITGISRNAPGYRVRRPDGSGDHLLMFTLSGTGQFRGNGHILSLPPTSIIWIPRGTPQDYGTGPGRRIWTSIWAHFRPWRHWEELLGWPQTPTGACLLQLEDSALLADVERDLRDMHAEAISGHPHRELRAMHALERVLLRCDEVNPLQSSNRLDSRIQAAVDHLHAHLADALTVDELAGIANLSPSRFAHLFTDQMGVAPLQYVETQRINRARDLLACTSRPIAELAEEVGFPNPYYFSRRFRKTTGLSPREYRREVTAQA